MYKGLVTSGCSFSLWDSPGWNQYLQQQLLFDGILSEDFDSFHRGLGGNGNMLIARSVIEALSRLLDKGVKGEDILCIVQWSGISRHQVFIDRESTEINEWLWYRDDIYQYDIGARDFNPIIFEDGKEMPKPDNREELLNKKRNGYYLIHRSEGVFEDNSDYLNKIYYKYISNTPNDVIESLWNWTTLQNYCEVNNIKPYYTFMFEHDKEMLLDDDIGESWAWKNLRKNIIRDNVLTSITKYLKEDSRKNLFIPDGHPSTKGHKVFSDYLRKSLTSI